MWIKGLHIDGFGIFSDASLRPLKPGLTVFLGNNEAGKSTTLDFLRTMFFGFPRRNAAGRKLREPLAGGRHGGNLQLMDGEREVTLERRPGPHGGAVSLLGPNGSPLPESELSRMLGGITESFFCHVHAFTLDELQMAGKEDILAQLYGAGTGVGLALAEAEKQFDRQMADRFASGGQNPLINQLLKQFEQLGEELRTARDQTAEYARLEQELAEQGAALEEAQAACDALGRRQRLLRAVRDHWEDWVEIVDAEQRLAELPSPPAETPADAGELDQILLDRRLAEEKCRSLAEECEAVRIDIAAVRINESLQARRSEIRSLARQAGEYQTARQRLPLLAQEAEQTRGALTDCLSQLGPDWREERIATCDRSLAVRGEIDSHLKALGDAERALRDVETTTRALADEHRQAEEQCVQADALRGRTAATLDSYPRTTCARMRGERDRLVAISRGVPEQRRDAERLRREVDQQAKSIDAEWTAERLVAFDTSAVAREQLQQAREKLARAAREREAATRALAEAQQQLERLGEPATGDSDLPEEATVRDRRRDLRRLAQAVTERDALAKLPAPPSPHRRWLPVLGMAAVLFVSLGIAYPVFLLGLLLPAAALPFVLRAPATRTPSPQNDVIASLSARLGLDPTSPDFDAADQRLEEQQAQLQMAQERERRRKEAEEKVQQTRRVQQQADEQVHSTEEEWARRVAELGFSGQPSPETVLNVLPDIAEGQRRATEAARLETAIADAERTLADAWQQLLAAKPPEELPATFSAEALDRLLRAEEAASQALDEATARVGAARAAAEERRVRHEESNKARAEAARVLEEVRAAWAQWLTEQGLQPSLVPETAREALATMARAWDLAQSVSKLEAEAQRHRATCAATEAKLLELLSGLDRAPVTATETESAIAALAEESEENEKRQVAVAELRKQEAKATAAWQRAETRQAECATALDAYLRTHAAEDVEGLRERIEAARQRREAQAIRDAGLKNLRTALGTADAGTVRELFAGIEQASVPAELAEVEQELATSEEQRETARNQRAKKLQELEALMSSDEIARLHQEQEAVRAEINALAVEWTRARLSRRLLEEAKRTFERERQPQVLKEASDFFRLLTGERYHGVFSPLTGTRELRALLPDNESRAPDELSRGTVEQLYLALRFGFLANSAHQSAVLPVMMDEILVNFDAERAAATARAIAQLSRTHQILFFTCHPTTADLLQTQANASLVQIRDARFSA